MSPPPPSFDLRLRACAVYSASRFVHERLSAGVAGAATCTSMRRLVGAHIQIV